MTSCYLHHLFDTQVAQTLLTSFEIILLTSFCRNCREISAEKLLCRELMRNYTTIGRNGRPVVNMSKLVLVEFGLGLIQMDLDEKNKILSTSMWSRYVSSNYAQETVASPCLRN